MRAKSKLCAMEATIAALFGAVASCGGGLDTDLFDDPGDPSQHFGDASTLPQGADASADSPIDGSDDQGAADAGAPDGAWPPPPPYDGICTPGPMSTGVYDPDCVYLLGTVQEGSCGYDALIYPANPNDRVYDFGCNAWLPRVRPTDGRLIFVSSVNEPDQAYAYRPQTTRAQWDRDQLALQEKLDTCPLLNRIYSFPDNTKMLYDCWSNDGGSGPYIDGAPFDMAGYDGPLAGGEGGSVLAWKQTPELEYGIVVNGVATPVTGLANADIFAQRSRRGGGFLIADWGPNRGELREVLPSGDTVVRGTYQTDRTHGPAGPDCVLEPGGALVCLDWSDYNGLRYDEIVRYTVDAPLQVIYQERTNDVKIHISSLATGP